MKKLFALVFLSAATFSAIGQGNIFNYIRYNDYNRSASAVNGETWRWNNHFYVKLNGVDVQLDGQAGAVSSVFGRTGAVVAQANDYTFAQIGSKPTTLSGYGITDPVVLTSGSYANPSWITSLAWSKITSTPTTLSGYGITDAIDGSGTAGRLAYFTDANSLSSGPNWDNANTRLGIGGPPTFTIHGMSTVGTSKIQIETSAAAETGVRIVRTVNTPVSWELYSPIGSTDLRVYNGIDRVTITNAGNLILNTGNLLAGTTVASARLHTRGANNDIAFLAEDDSGGDIIESGETSGSRYTNITGSFTLVTPPTNDNTETSVLVRQSNGEVQTANDFVKGPGASTDNGIARFDGTTGKLIQNSPVTISDDGGQLFFPVSAIIGGVGSISVKGVTFSSSGISSSSGGFKHERIDTNSILAGSCDSYTVIWDTTFGDTNYTATLSPEDGTGGCATAIVLTKSATQMTIRVCNCNSGGGSNFDGQVNVIAVHD